MGTERINIIFFGRAAIGGKVFFDALSNLELPHFIINFRSVEQILAYLNSAKSVLPTVLTFYVSKHNQAYLVHIKTIRKIAKYKNLTILLYDPLDCIDEEEAFAAGANMYMHKVADAKQLKKRLKQILGTTYQFQESNLNNETFFLSI